MKAFCYASGLIEFGEELPDGALPIASGRKKPLRDFIEVQARHGYSTRVVNCRPTKIPGTETLLVPVEPQAPDDGAGLDALHAWLDWCRKHAPKGVSVFGS